MKKLVLIAVAMMSFALGCGGGGEKPGMTADNPLEIKMVRPWSTAAGSIKLFYLPFIERVNKATEGRVIFTDFGGPEVAPAFEQFRPLLENQFQALYTHASYMQEFTAIGTAGDYVKGGWDVRAECGLISSVQEAYAAKGTHFLGPNVGAGYKIYLADEITSPDLSGLKIRSSGVYDPFIKALGGVATRIPFPEIYTSLEKGIIDGAAYASSGAHRGSWYNIVNYWVDDELGNGGGTGIHFNQKTWDAIPDDMKKVIEDLYEEMAKANMANSVADSQQTDEKMRGEGTIGIKFDAAGMKKWQDTWYTEGKKAFVDSDPDYGQSVGAAMECVKAKQG